MTASPCRVLVVDDSASIRDLVTLLLELEDDFVVVGKAANGEQAVRAGAETQPDLVVLDLAMPVMDGARTLEELRRVSPGAKVVIFSGFEDQRLSALAQRHGADGYIDKASGAIAVVDRLRDILRR